MVLLFYLFDWRFLIFYTLNFNHIKTSEVEMIANKNIKYIMLANIIFHGVLDRNPGNCLQFGNGCSASRVIAYPQIGQYEKSNLVLVPQWGHFILPPLSTY